jgi:ribonucleoside-diphosphate reductase alpha chain
MIIQDTTQMYFDQLHSEKYRDKGQTKEQHNRKLAKNLSSNTPHENKIYDILSNDRFLPAGRVQAALGAEQREVSPFNCTVSQTINDDMLSIMNAVTNAAMILRLGTGIGYNFSNIRPKGALIKKLQTQASGPLSFMEIFDVMASTIASSGHRRGAQMGVLDVSHPDIEAFIEAKLTPGKYRQFNLSVNCTSDFMDGI